ncbi:hypothetical protein AZI98_05465 [Aeribacillus pallidus]|uniref:Uncharacterized protein n=1 Tax=Aeribacillus pallidus TaxID=33936 RepID=A0A165YF95_9BACI|nr:hypothetical protein AZI98_05465 [Aeribacillus pallidus]
MLKSTLIIMSILLVTIHFAILYFWMFDWQKLATKTGFISWFASILLGIFVYFTFQTFSRCDKAAVVIRNILLCSTLLTIFLACIAFIIEAITKAMP